MKTLTEIVQATHWLYDRYYCASCLAEYCNMNRHMAEDLTDTRYALDTDRHCYNCCPCRPCRTQAVDDLAAAGDVYLDMYRAKRAWLQSGDGISVFGNLLQAIVELHRHQPPTDYPQLNTNLEEMVFQADEKRPSTKDPINPGKPSTQQTAASVIGAAANAATVQNTNDLKAFFRLLGCRDD